MMMHRVLAESTSTIREGYWFDFRKSKYFYWDKERDPFHMDILTGI